MKKICVGIDLAGKNKNITGFCVLKNNIAETKSLYTDNEIIDEIMSIVPDIIAIDSPFIFPPKIRKCDKILKKYGAMPPTFKGMSVLSERGANLSEILKKK